MFELQFFALQNTAEEFISTQCEDKFSFNDYLGSFGDLSSVADFEKNVNLYPDLMTPKAFLDVDTYPLSPEISTSTDDTFTECFSQEVIAENPSSYVSQDEELQLNPLALNIYSISPDIQKPCAPGTPITSDIHLNTSGMLSTSDIYPSISGNQPNTPSAQYSEVEQSLSMDGSEVNIVFNSHKSATSCRNWYGAVMQVVSEVVKPVQSVKKEFLQIKLPGGGNTMLIGVKIFFKSEYR